MKKLLLVLALVLGGCGVSQVQKCGSVCVNIGGGELQPGLAVDLGCGTVVVTEVLRRGGNPIGFKAQSTAPYSFYIVTTAKDAVCIDGSEFVSDSIIQSLDFCTCADGDKLCALQVAPQ